MYQVLWSELANTGVVLSPGRNITGSYAWTSMDIAEFLFSISEETARKYLPNHYAHFCGEIGRVFKAELTMTPEFVAAVKKEKGGEQLLQKIALEFNTGGPSH